MEVASGHAQTPITRTYEVLPYLLIPSMLAFTDLPLFSNADAFSNLAMMYATLSCSSEASNRTTVPHYRCTRKVPCANTGISKIGKSCYMSSECDGISRTHVHRGGRSLRSIAYLTLAHVDVQYVMRPAL